MKYSKVYISVILSIMLFQMCSDPGENREDEQIPVIKNVSTKAYWNLAFTKYNKVEATVFDPQGISNVDSVVITFLNSAGQSLLVDQLYDDGANYHNDDGDVIAGDGVFSNRFNAATDIDTIAGEYHFEIIAFDKDGNSSEQSIININLGSSFPTGFAYVQSPDTLKSGVDAAYLYAALSQMEGIEAVEYVSFSLYTYNTDDSLESNSMFNDGDSESSGDMVATDSIFSYKLDYNFAAERKGLYDIGFTVADIYGTITHSHRIGIYLENESGEILELSVPDSMEKPILSGTYRQQLLTANVADPQGLTDIDSVYFYSRKPDGTYANSGNPILLVDNGKPFNINNPADEAGDETAGDGIYSFSLLLDSAADPGIYTFSFYMRDKVGNLSMMKSDSIEVY